MYRMIQRPCLPCSKQTNKQKKKVRPEHCIKHTLRLTIFIYYIYNTTLSSTKNDGHENDHHHHHHHLKQRSTESSQSIIFSIKFFPLYTVYRLISFSLSLFFLKEDDNIDYKPAAVVVNVIMIIDVDHNLNF